jgi:HlyD family secretion protein
VSDRGLLGKGKRFSSPRWTMSEGLISAANSAPDRASISFDQLDRLVRVTTIQGWAYLGTLFAVCLAAVLFAVLYRVPTKVHGEGILLIDRDTLAQVRASGTGRLVALDVKVGDPVTANVPIGVISQDELKDAIHEAEFKLSDAEREDLELTRFEQQARESQTEAIERVRNSILAAQGTSKDKLRIAGRVVSSADRLRAQSYLGDIELLESREKLYVIKDDLNKGQSRLAELELEAINAETVRRRAQLERSLKVRQLKTKLGLDRDKLLRTSQIVSRVNGRVAQVLSARGELVHEGSPVLLLHAPKAERGSDDDGPAYESIVFVPAGEGKKIEIHDAVEVSPATVKREEHGFIKGRVVAISELPATKLAMEAALEHPELVDTFLKRYAPGVLLRVHVKLDESDVSTSSDSPRPPSERLNHFRWSSSSGHAQPLKTGTMCQVAIVVEKRRLISLILPWTKTVVGTD